MFAPGRQVVVTGRRVGLQKVGIAMYYVMLILGAVSAGTVWRLRRRYALALATPFIATSVTAVLTYSLVRLREGADVSLLVFAAAGTAALTRALETRRR